MCSVLNKNRWFFHEKVKKYQYFAKNMFLSKKCDFFGVFGQLEFFPQIWNFQRNFLVAALHGELWYEKMIENKQIFATIFQARIWCHIFEAFNSSLLVLVAGVYKICYFHKTMITWLVLILSTLDQVAPNIWIKKNETERNGL